MRIRSGHVTLGLTTLLGVLIGAATVSMAGRSSVELLRLDLGPSSASPSSESATPFALVVHVPPGRRFVRATCDVRRGHAVTSPGAPRAAARARRAALTRVGVDLVARRLSTELGVTVELLGSALTGRLPSEPVPVVRGTRLSLRERDVASHANYAVAIVELRTTPLTRIDCTRIVTRRDRRVGAGDEKAGGDRRRDRPRRRARERAAPAMAPPPGAPGLSRDGLDDLLRGRYPFPHPID